MSFFAFFVIFAVPIPQHIYGEESNLRPQTILRPLIRTNCQSAASPILAWTTLCAWFADSAALLTNREAWRPEM